MGQKPGKAIPFPLNRSTPLVDVLSAARIPADAVQLVMKNHKASVLDVTIEPGDRLALFPKEYPFFVDWYEFRNRPKPEK